MHRSDSERPRALVNSLPKSGTNLLLSILGNLEGLRYQRIALNRRLRWHPLNYLPIGSGRRCLAGVNDRVPVRLATIRFQLRLIRPGGFAGAHLVFDEAVMEAIRGFGIRPFFVIRDPRDVVVSQSFFVMKEEKHYLHRDFAAMATQKERLLASIRGLRERGGAVRCQGIAERLESIAPWMGEPGVLTCRFEQLIGPRGGGDPDAQVATIQAVAQHLGRTLSAAEARGVGERAFGTAWTFRSGRRDGWRELFDDEVKQVFKQHAGRQLVEMGYEPDDDW